MATYVKAPARKQPTGKAAGPISRDGKNVGTPAGQLGQATAGHKGRTRTGPGGQVGVSGNGGGGTTAPGGKRVAKRG